MNRSIADRVESAALHRPRGERARLAERLSSSLDEDSDVERARAEEVERRVAELRSGTVRAVPGERVFEELNDLIR